MAGLVALGVVIGFTSLLFIGNLFGEPSAGQVDGAREAKAKAKPMRLLREEALTVFGKPLERPDPPADAKSLILVVLTAVRRDHVEAYGADWGRTPFFGELGRQGTVFDDVISASPFSRTAAPAFLAGAHAATFDLVEPGPGPNHRVLPESATTLAEVLRDAGWATFGVTANFNYNSDAGFAQGFDTYRNAQAQGFHPRARTYGGKVRDRATEIVATHLEQTPDRPFFLFVNFVDAHAPLRVAPDEVAQFDPERPNARYRAVVARVDGYVRGLVDAVEKRDRSRDTDLVVAILGDHGEGLEQPAHHGEMHGRLLYGSSVRVPWIMSGAGVAKGHRVEGLVSHVDVMPTLVDFLGVPVPEAATGTSLAQHLRGERSRTERSEAFSDTWYFTANRSSIWTATTQCQLDFGTTGLDDGFADACYDRTSDPEFTSPEADPDLTKRLRAWRQEVSASVGTSGSEMQP